MMVRITARHGPNQHSGLELHRAYRAYDGPDQHGRVLVFDDNTTSFRWVTPAEYAETSDPLDRHDLVRIDHGAGGFAPVCSCVWRWRQGWPDPDEAARAHGIHQRHMAAQRRLLQRPADPAVLAWAERLREQRRHHGRGQQGPER